MNDPAIEALNLSEPARNAAYALKRAHPSVKFTSGRRGVGQQAMAMASNVIKNRNWIAQTYKASALRDKCQKWVNANPTKVTQEAIAAGLLSVLISAPDVDLGKFSKHLSGSAFDVQPIAKGDMAIKATIRALPGLTKFLEEEGGLVRWHCEF